MKPIWYIHHRRDEFDAETQRLFYVPQELGMEAVICKEVPFNGGIVDRFGHPFGHPLDNIPEKTPLIFHGGIGLIRQAQRLSKIRGYLPWTWCDWDALACRSYYAHWGKYLLQQDYAFYPWGELPRLKEKLYRLFGVDNRGDNQIFIRPDSNDKIFNGELIADGRFDAWAKYGSYSNPPEDTLCVVCRPEKIDAEYRCIVVNGKVITGSQYRKQGVVDISAEYPKEVNSFVEEVVSIWTPHPIFCFDVAATEGGYKVIECGSVNCAGFYACDLRPIVQAMSDICQKEYDDAYGDL